MTKQKLAAEKAELGIVPDAKEVFGRRYATFASLVSDLVSVNAIKKEAEAESKRINLDLQSMWADVGHKTVLNDGAKVTLVESSNSSIKKERLVELGVPAATIVEATVVTPYSFVKVTAAKE